MTSTHVAVLVVHNEAVRLVHLLDYYRALGVEHFVIIDNRSDDDLRAMVRDASDVSIFSAHGSYKAARFGNDWVNYVLTRYCSGKWILYVDADEYLLFYGQENRSLTELTESLEQSGERSLRTIMLDMYSESGVEQNICDRGQNPLDVCNLYDASGYVPHFDELSRTTWIKGGVRARLSFDDVSKSPALNKTPLVHWKWHYAFLKSAHQLFPPSASGPIEIEALPRAGVLLHFKFLSNFTQKVAAEVKRQEHTEEYAAYADLHTRSFVGPQTRTYASPDSLVHDRILRPQ